MSSSILCPTHYCVQHIIVSNKILCPHFPKGSFVSFHISMCCGRIRLRLRSTFISYFRHIYGITRYRFNKYRQMFLNGETNILHGNTDTFKMRQNSSGNLFVVFFFSMLNPFSGKIMVIYLLYLVRYLLFALICRYIPVL